MNRYSGAAPSSAPAAEPPQLPEKERGRLRGFAPRVYLAVGIVALIMVAAFAFNAREGVTMAPGPGTSTTAI